MHYVPQLLEIVMHSLLSVKLSAGSQNTAQVRAFAQLCAHACVVESFTKINGYSKKLPSITVNLELIFVIIYYYRSNSIHDLYSKSWKG